MTRVRVPDQELKRHQDHVALLMVDLANAERRAEMAEQQVQAMGAVQIEHQRRLDQGLEAERELIAKLGSETKRADYEAKAGDDARLALNNLLSRAGRMKAALEAIHANASAWYETQTEMHQAHRDLFLTIAASAGLALAGAPENDDPGGWKASDAWLKADRERHAPTCDSRKRAISGLPCSCGVNPRRRP